MADIAHTINQNLANLSEAKLPRFGGYALNALFSESTVRCLFDSMQSAQQFRRFCEIYVNDAQPGNSYGGYFPPEFSKGAQEIERVRIPALGKFWSIWPETVTRMFREICQARLAHNRNAFDPAPREQLKEWLLQAPVVRCDHGYHKFAFNEAQLPPRLQPTELGQLVAVVEDPRYRREHAYYVTDVGTKSLIALFRLNTNPSMEMLVLVDRKHLMRIHDFYQENEAQREANGYGMMKERLLVFALTKLRESDFSLQLPGL